MEYKYEMPVLTDEARRNAIAHAAEALQIFKHQEDISLIYQIALAALTADPIGKVVKGEVSDSNEYPDARVSCLHDQADWENFKDGYQLYDAPPVPVVKAVSLPKAKGPQFVYHGGKGAFDAGKDAGFNEALLLCTEALYAAGYEVKE